jgi:hypothetical protein
MYILTLVMVSLGESGSASRRDDIGYSLDPEI